MTAEDAGSVDVGWVRVAEALLATGILAVLFVVAVGVGRVERVLSTARPRVYALTVPLALAWLLSWGWTLFLLFDREWPGLDRPRFMLAFLGATGVRGLVPGGSVSGPAVVAYVVTTSTEADAEGGVALAYLAEFCYWLGSVALATAGLVAIVLTRGPSEGVLSVAAGVGAVFAVVVGLVALAARHPAAVRGWVVGTADWLRRLLGDRVPAARSALDPEAVRARVDRLFGAFGRVAADPRGAAPAVAAAVSGWVAHVLVLAVALTALGVDPPVGALLFVVPVGGVARALSVLPGGIGGVAPTMAALLWTVAGVPPAVAGTAVLLFRLSTYWFRLALGAAALLTLGVIDAGIPRPRAGRVE